MLDKFTMRCECCLSSRHVTVGGRSFIGDPPYREKMQLGHNCKAAGLLTGKEVNKNREKRRKGKPYDAVAESIEYRDIVRELRRKLETAAQNPDIASRPRVPKRVQFALPRRNGLERPNI